MANAKDQNTEELPKMVYIKGIEINEENLPEEFAKYFESKVDNLTANANINPGVFTMIG